MEIAILVVAIITLGVTIFFECLRRKKRVYIETTKYQENDLTYIQVRVTDKHAVQPHFRRGPELICRSLVGGITSLNMNFDIEFENSDNGFGKKEVGDFHVIYKFHVNEIKNMLKYGDHKPTGIIKVETEDGVIETSKIPDEIFKLLVE